MTTLSLPLPRVGASIDNSAVERAREYAEAAHAENTRRGYSSDLSSFGEWCQRTNLSPLPAAPQTVVLYVTHLAANRKLSTIRRHVAAIAYAHREHGLESPVAHEIVRRVVRGVARTIGAAQTKKAAVTLDALRAMLLAIHGDGLKAKRDRALLLLGFSAALRRSELAALEVGDLRLCSEGLRVIVRRSKTDQIGDGVEIAVPLVKNSSLCAVRAVRAWLEASGLTEGPIFRSFTLQRRMTDRSIEGYDVANLVKALARRARLDGDYSAHSLRAGFVTCAAQGKASLDSIARTSRHKSLPVLMGYVRPAQAFDDVALASIID